VLSPVNVKAQVDLLISKFMVHAISDAIDTPLDLSNLELVDPETPLPVVGTSLFSSAASLLKTWTGPLVGGHSDCWLLIWKLMPVAYEAFPQVHHLGDQPLHIDDFIDWWKNIIMYATLVTGEHANPYCRQGLRQCDEDCLVLDDLTQEYKYCDEVGYCSGRRHAAGYFTVTEGEPLHLADIAFFEYEEDIPEDWNPMCTPHMCDNPEHHAYLESLRDVANEIAANQPRFKEVVPAIVEYVANKELIPALEDASKMAWHWTKSYFDDLGDLIVHRPHPGDHLDPLPPIGSEPIDVMPGPVIPIEGGNLEHMPVVGPEPIDMMPGPFDPGSEIVPQDLGIAAFTEQPDSVAFIHDMVQYLHDLPDLLSPWFSQLSDEAAFLAEYLSAFSSDLATLSTDLFQAGLHAHEVAAPFFRLVNICLADSVERHGANMTFVKQRKFYLLAAFTTQLAGRDYALLPPSETTDRVFATEVPGRFITLLESANAMDESTASAQTVANEIRRKLNNAVNDLNSLPTFYVDPTVDDGQIKALQSAAPEFNFCRGVTTSPHSLLQVLRNVFRRRVVSAVGHLRLPLALIGASAPEITYFAANCPILHNCGPILSGRDEYRLNHAHGDVSQTHGAFSVDHTFQKCTYHDQNYASYAVCSLFASHDTDVADFVLAMTRKNVRTAYVALHLPVPMLDERIREFTDTLTGLRFVKRGDSIDVFHLNSGSAGYSHRADALLSWLKPWATAPGLHITIETIAQFGSAHLFCIQLGAGTQETVPVVRRTMLEDFYILPSLYDDTLVEEERRFFAMPAKRFEQLVAFVRTSEQQDRTLEKVSNKLRGQMAMIKVGKNVIEPRLDLDLEQMTSVAYHALLAEELTRRSAQVVFNKARYYYRRMLRRNSYNIIVRFLTYHADNYLLRLNNKKTYLDHSAIERFQRWFFNSRTDNSETYNPYTRANDYFVLIKPNDSASVLIKPHTRFKVYLKRTRTVFAERFDACRRIVNVLRTHRVTKSEAVATATKEIILPVPPPLSRPPKPLVKISNFDMNPGGNYVEVPILDDLDRALVPDAFEDGLLYAGAQQELELLSCLVGRNCACCDLPLRFTDVEMSGDYWRDYTGLIDSISDAVCKECAQGIVWDDCAGCLLSTPELGHVPRYRGLYCRNCYNNDFKRYDVKIYKDPMLELINTQKDRFAEEGTSRTLIDQTATFDVPLARKYKDVDTGSNKEVDFASDTGSDEITDEPKATGPVLPVEGDNAAPGVHVVKLPLEFGPVKRTMDFGGSLRDNVPGHRDDTEFCKRIVTEKPFVGSWETVNCPSVGAAALLSEWYHLEPKIHGSYRAIDKDFISDGFNALGLPRHMMSTFEDAYDKRLRNGSSDPEWNAVYQKHPIFCNAYKCLRHAMSGANKMGIASFDMITIDGPPMCAKSTLVRMFLERERLRYNVVVPSKALRDDWIEKLGSDRRHVFTRHGVSNSPVDVVVIDEIFNFNPVELECIIRARCSPYRALKVICLGDVYQNTGTDDALRRFDLAMKQSVFLNMRTALGLPTDALYLYLRANGLSLDHYETTGRDDPSVFFVPKEMPLPTAPDLAMTLYQEVFGFEKHHLVAEGSTRTVAQAQGRRSVFGALGGCLSGKVLEWVKARPGRMSVAYTRHNGSLWIPVDDRNIHALIPAGVDVIPYVYVKGAVAGFKDRLIVPFALDILLSEPELKDKAKSSRVLSDLGGLNSVVKGVNPDKEQPVDRQPDVQKRVDYHDVQGHIFERVEELAPLTERLDIELPDGGIRKMRRPELPEDKQLRNGFDDVTGLAAIQSASDEFRSLRDMCDRQFSQSHPVKRMDKGMAEGIKLYERFKQCYYTDESKIFVDWEADTAWYNSRLTAFLDRLKDSEPLYATADSVTMESFRKSQSKVKPIPDYAASDPYGQQIIAAPPAFTARFAPACQKMQVNLPRLMRNDMIPDFGMSDDDLSSVIRRRGLEHIFDEAHTQFDLSKQDSTHSLPMLYCFILISFDCGVDEGTMLEYLHACSSYYVRAQFSDLFAGVIAFNLGSGDPFTLIRNCVMMLTAIANTFHDADRAQGVQKGDDWTGWLPSFRLHVNANLRSMQIINWKPALTALKRAGVAPYHAGRFWIGHRFVADPVRVFYKHLTRLKDTNVPVRELYNSFISRAVDYTPAEAHVLENVVCSIYEDITPEQCQLIICVVSAMNDFKFFSALISGIKNFDYKIIDTTDCIYDCLTAMRPDMSEATRASFRNLPLRTLVKRLRSYGIEHRVVDNFPPVLEVGVIYLTSSHAVVRTA
jgi:hypothetical protein